MKIYNAYGRFDGQPEELPGVERLITIAQSRIVEDRDAYVPAMIDRERLKRIIDKYPYAERIVLDMEHNGWTATPREDAVEVARRLKSGVDLANIIRPGLSVAYYGLRTGQLPPTPLQGGDPIKWWLWRRAHRTIVESVAAKVWACCPSLYMGEHEGWDDWRKRAARIVRIARKWNRPVVPYISPRRNGSYSPLDVFTWVGMLRWLKQRPGVEGVAVWMETTLPGGWAKWSWWYEIPGLQSGIVNGHPRKNPPGKAGRISHLFASN